MYSTALTKRNNPVDKWSRTCFAVPIPSWTRRSSPVTHAGFNDGDEADCPEPLGNLACCQQTERAHGQGHPASMWCFCHFSARTAHRFALYRSALIPYGRRPLFSRSLSVGSNDVNFLNARQAPAPFLRPRMACCAAMRDALVQAHQRRQHGKQVYQNLYADFRIVDLRSE